MQMNLQTGRKKWKAAPRSQVGNADGSDAEKEDTKGSDTTQWMGQVETDETKLQDNQLEYSELYTLISRYNPTIEQFFNQF